MEVAKILANSSNLDVTVLSGPRFRLSPLKLSTTRVQLKLVSNELLKCSEKKKINNYKYSETFE